MSYTIGSCYSEDAHRIYDFSNLPESQSLAKGIEELL
jgi:hypothetical protein